MFKLRSPSAERMLYVSIVGCGGSGGYAAESLCRLLPKQALILLIDHDRVEERNLKRQNFLPEDIGSFKSEVLSKRLSKKFNRPIGYSTLPVSMTNILTPGVIIGCVDNGLARRDIAAIVEKKVEAAPYIQQSWWVDAGNGDLYGQIIIGNGKEVSFLNNDTECCYELPLPTIQQPDLLKQQPQPQSCAIDDEQSPNINLVMASLVTEVVRRIIEGSCPWSQLYLDMQAGTLTPIYIHPIK